MNFIKHRKTWLTFSFSLVIASVVILFVRGLNLGVDFTGGSLLEVQVSENVTVDMIKENLASIENSNEIVGSAKVQPSEENVYLLRTKELNDENHMLVLEKLSTLDAFKELSYTRIGPVVGESLKEKAIIALFIALCAIVLYISYAFRKVPRFLSSWRFGFIAIITLFHDVLITLGVFSLFGWSIDMFFITAVLTILGYSVNDTIVVFDRVRETVIRRLFVNFQDAAEYSIKSTLVRSLNTSITLLITLFALFFFAGSSIRFFILALIIGVSIGTYSSIFVATPLLVVAHEAKDKSARNINREQKSEEKQGGGKKTSKKKFKKRRR